MKTKLSSFGLSLTALAFSKISFALPRQQTEPFPDWAIKNLDFMDMLFGVAILFFALGLFAFLVALPFIAIGRGYNRYKKNKANKESGPAAL